MLQWSLERELGVVGVVGVVGVDVVVDVVDVLYEVVRVGLE